MTLRRWRTFIFAGVVGVFALVLASPSPSSGISKVTDTWHLDRINQRTLPLDNVSTPSATLNGAGIDVYIVDTGTNYSHEQFGGRAVYGIDIARSASGSIVDPRGSDCDGHGTHVASSAAGTTTGVAPGSRVFSVRVLDCNGLGEVADVVKGLRWIADHHTAGRLAIANLSLGVDLGDDGGPLDKAVRRLVADGVVVVVAAGNGDNSGRPIDACRISPADEPIALTVGAVTVDDALSSFSNFGPCVDVFAPGGSNQRPVVGAWYTSPTAYNNEKGTSMASPLVAGYAALLAQQQPHLCPSQVHDAVVARATPNLISGLDATTPNRLLFLDTTPIVGTVSPGRSDGLVVSAHNGALRVSWDRPCSGGSIFKRTTISVYRDGQLVKSVTSRPGATQAIVSNLRNNVSYGVSVRTATEVARSRGSVRVASPQLRSLRVGNTVRVSQLVKTQQGDEPKVSVVSTSKSVCSLQRNPQRLVAKSRGTCKVKISPKYAEKTVTHTFTVQ
jgi:subtilisin family serine protease